MIDVGLFLSYFLVGICLVTAIGMPLVKAFGDPQALKKIGTGIGALLLVFVVSYFIADGTAYGDANETTAKLVGAGLFTMYILAFGAILGIVITEIKKATS